MGTILTPNAPDQRGAHPLRRVVRRALPRF